MHMMIRVLTYGKTREEGFEKAKEVLEDLVDGERGRPFDWYTTFDDDSATTSGKARFGETPFCVEADSKEGKELIKEGHEATKREFMEHIARLRVGLDNFTDEQLFEEQDKFEPKREDYINGFFKYNAHCVGQYAGSQIWLYDNDGQGIRDTETLNNVLSKWKCLYEDKGQENPHKEDKVWVTPVDVHH